MPQSKPDLELVDVPDHHAWERWLEQNHDASPGVWLKIAKKGAPTTTPTYEEALDAAIAYGWIDGQKGALDEHYWRQRFTRRGPRSKWSQINRERAERLIETNRMRPSGQRQVDAARHDGRWDNAYPPASRITPPEDFQRALDANPKARAFFETLTGPNRYAFLYRILDAKRPQTRAKRIETFIDMLNDQRTFH